MLGRIVEVLTGKTWDAALKERIIEPLGLTATVTLPEEALLHRAAVGHLREPGQPQIPTTVLLLPRSVGPAGLITARVRDVLEFARMHLAGGVAPDGMRVLSAESAAAMPGEQVRLPDRSTIDAWGLGWMRFDWNGTRLFGHDGNTIGQSAFLRMLPRSDGRHLAVSLSTNGGDASKVEQALFGEIFAPLAEVVMPEPFTAPEVPPTVDLEQFVGSYRRTGMESEVTVRDGALVLRATTTGPLAALSPDPITEFTGVTVDEHGHFAVRTADDPTWRSFAFYTLDDGAAYLHHGIRANPRVGVRPAGTNDEE